MKVLIVEDEVKTAAYLQKGLAENGFNVDVADNGEDGLFSALNYDYDIIILDIMLPKLDGWELARKIRVAGKKNAILFLTARDEVSDRVKGLELGGDDYLIKPFAFSELLARVRSLLRRSSVRQPDVITMGDLEIDFPRQKATRRGVRLDLTAKEFLLLSLFIRRKGEVLSRTLIAEQVWDINFDTGTNVVDVAVRRLRQKLDDAHESKFIRTVRGVGYVFEEGVTENV